MNVDVVCSNGSLRYGCQNVSFIVTSAVTLKLSTVKSEFGFLVRTRQPKLICVFLDRSL